MISSQTSWRVCVRLGLQLAVQLVQVPEPWPHNWRQCVSSSIYWIQKLTVIDWSSAGEEADYQRETRRVEVQVRYQLPPQLNEYYTLADHEIDWFSWRGRSADFERARDTTSLLPTDLE